MFAFVMVSVDVIDDVSNWRIVLNSVAPPVVAVPNFKVVAVS